MSTPPWTVKLSKKIKADPVTAETRALVKARSGGRCELCGNAGEHLHHRQLRRGGDHGAANLVDLCNHCHQRVHGHPNWALGHGWLVSQFALPALAPLNIGDEWFVHDETGRRIFVRATPPAAKDD